jgi:hypothetical protein
MKTIFTLFKTGLFLQLFLFLSFAVSFDSEAQGIWIEQLVKPSMSGTTLTKTGSDCVIHTRTSSKYVYFFDIKSKAWSECDLGIQQNIKAVEAGKHVVFAYSDSLLVAYSSVTSTYQVINYSGNILSPQGQSTTRGYGCGDYAAYVWTDENYFYVFDALAGQWTSFYSGAMANATGTGNFWCGDNYVAGIFPRYYPDKYRNVAYSLITNTFNSTEMGGAYVGASFSAPMTGGFVTMWGGAPDAVSFAGYSSFINEFFYSEEPTPYGSINTSQIWDESWSQFKERNLFGYCVTRGTGYGEPRNVKINMFDTKRTQWHEYSFTYSSIEFGEVGVGSVGGNICTFIQQGIDGDNYPLTFYVYNGETGSYQDFKPGIYYPGYLNSGNNFSVFLDNKKNNWFYNNKTDSVQKIVSDSNYVNVASSSDYVSFCRYNPSSSFMDIWYYNSITDRVSKIKLSKDVYPDFKYSSQAYIFTLTSPEKSAVFYSPIRDSILSVNTALADGNSSYGAFGVFSFLYNSTASLLFDAVNMKIVNMNAPPAAGGLSDSLILFKSGNVFDVYDASNGNITTFNMGEAQGYQNNGGNIILLSNLNYSRFYAFRKGFSKWVDLIPEGSTLWYSSAENTAVVARNTKVYAFAPDDFTNIEIDATDRPQTFKLNQNYPNPFNKTTTISWQLPQDSHIVLKVFDFTSREVKTLVDCDQAEGEHQVTFNAADLPAGVYFYLLQANGSVEIKKMIVIK